MEENLGQAQKIVASRRERHRDNMILTIQGIKRRAEMDVSGTKKETFLSNPISGDV